MPHILASEAEDRNSLLNKLENVCKSSDYANNELANGIFVACQSTLTMLTFEGAQESEATIHGTRDTINELRHAHPGANILFSSQLFNTNVMPIKILKELYNL